MLAVQRVRYWSFGLATGNEIGIQQPGQRDSRIGDFDRNPGVMDANRTQTSHKPPLIQHPDHYDSFPKLVAGANYRFGCAFQGQIH